MTGVGGGCFGRSFPLSDPPDRHGDPRPLLTHGWTGSDVRGRREGGWEGFCR